VSDCSSTKGGYLTQNLGEFCNLEIGTIVCSLNRWKNIVPSLSSITNDRSLENMFCMFDSTALYLFNLKYKLQIYVFVQN